MGHYVSARVRPGRSVSKAWSGYLADGTGLGLERWAFRSLGKQAFWAYIRDGIMVPILDRLATATEDRAVTASRGWAGVAAFKRGHS
jgi:hypothetical protein